MAYRKANGDEMRLIEALNAASSLPMSEGWLRNIKIENLNDEGMGSFKIHTEIEQGKGGNLIQLSMCRFRDSDGVEVIATLYADPSGEPFEVDLWKTDFSILVRIPESLQGESCLEDVGL